MEEKTIENAMAIILHAGDARVHCKKALDAIATQDFNDAKSEMSLATKDITKAHIVQTDAIQAETRGEASEYSLLFAHAQDTLMTIYSEINIAKQMIKIFECYETRLTKIENSK